MKRGFEFQTAVLFWRPSTFALLCVAQGPAAKWCYLKQCHIFQVKSRPSQVEARGNQWQRIVARQFLKEAGGKSVGRPLLPFFN
ncbi:MAG: hypothetical protein BA865_02135 [Desulfobacterales bacterium S5133MH4]|nr:MAG: hypothetical protein BA865_02135 [Desulfobacterales bacterium S5133MH4]